MTLPHYLTRISTAYAAGNATEHTYRTYLQALVEAIVPAVQATNEPKRQACGAPDYIITHKGIPVGYIEAKDIADADLMGERKTGNKPQFDRYKASLENIIFTDYLDFYFYNDGVLIHNIAIAEVKNGKIIPKAENFARFENLIKDFCTYTGQTIKSPKKLAEMMAGKARILADTIEQALNQDEIIAEDSTLKQQMYAFQQILIHDITARSFADVYAQTIAYGMFAARLNDTSLVTFTRQEAAELIPKSNPFLRKLFGYIAGPDIDDRIKWIVDTLADIFLACNVEEILQNYGKATQMEDPIIHFYETFLTAYDPALRKRRGVWYTPAPVVNFIVRAVDDILKTEFGLPQGLADNSRTTIHTKVQNKAITKEVHRVQILDPATGTGTFLAEVIKHIHRKFENNQGVWSQYVDTHLLPRLNGFELLMASYAMAHLQLDLLLRSTGYASTTNDRLKVYLTNSLEESHTDTHSLFAHWLADEANEANRIKRDTPVMCIIGNPPYSGESANKGDWIMQLMEDYKKEPGGKTKLQERNPKWINDDYVKFLRFGQYFIEKNGSGILAYICPHGFLDNPTFRGMRWNLLKTYDKIYTIDLHGNAKKKETTPEGGIDQNLFEIMQGVSINIFVKTGKKKNAELGQILHYDLFGKREDKYQFLKENAINTIPYKSLPYTSPNFLFVPKNNDALAEYEKGFRVNEIFKLNSLGLLTKRDKFITDFEKESIKHRLDDFINAKITDEGLALKYDLKLNDNDNWDLKRSRIELVRTGIVESNFKVQNYRCFDKRFIYYDKNFVARLNTKVLQHLNFQNYCLISNRQLADSNFNHIFISDIISDQCFISNKTKEGCQVFPLYLYPEIEKQQSMYESAERKPNLDPKIIAEIAAGLGLRFVAEKTAPPNLPKGEELPYGSIAKLTQTRASTNPPPLEGLGEAFAPIDVLDYIYAVLHSQAYRTKYKEFLKIDFPRVPYPTSVAKFWALVALGAELRQVHLLENIEPKAQYVLPKYPIAGNNIVEKLRYEADNVYINETQYFGGVSATAWNFYIGGYQPAQKWLKDRRGRVLSYEDVVHYQSIILALDRTAGIMERVDEVMTS